jgi:hypothetical protein
MKALGVVSLLVFLSVIPARAGQNPDVSLAIHLVATYEYLDCPELCPESMSCEDIDCDLSLAELEASGGYALAVLLIYNALRITALEYFVTGWPEDAPDFSGPHYCIGDSVATFQEPFEHRGGEGGFVSFLVGCIEPCNSILCFGIIELTPETSPWLPITLQVSPSSWSYPADPHNTIQHCGPEMDEDPVVWNHHAVIGGECSSIPNCLPGPSAGRETSWGSLKSLYR